MKKLFAFLFISLISLQLFAKLTNKQVVGKWKYLVETDEGNLTGVFKFTETDGKLSGEVITSDGYTLPITKIEVRDNDTLYLEVKTDSDLITVSVKIDGNNFEGTAASYMGEAPVTGEKQE